ncbi:DMT family transporter [Paraburkholderia flava]|uniref:DMT family transporter n=1 Tax=Paraburkholderia flava TaxID=2547393 RepID=UPI0010600BC7|nr:DMT family transporter [Paraburkholderia flava]
MSATGLRQSPPLSFPGAALLMVIATALWGVSFVAPLMLHAYSPLDITFGRFLFYGIVSAAILLAKYRRHPLGWRVWSRAAVYGFAGNILFSILVSFGVQDTGAEVVIPIIGLLPICVSVAGNRHLPAATWRRLLVPFAMVACGLGVVLAVQSGILVQHVRLSWPGVFAVVVIVIVWTWYALSNSRFLRAHPDISGAHWSCAIGVATFGLSIVMAALNAALTHRVVPPGFLQGHAQDALLFVAITMVLGVGSSWLATIFFNRASHALPMGLVGQMIILETVFGIAYASMYQHTLPPAPQTAGMVLAIAGIWLSARELLK